MIQEMIHAKEKVLIHFGKEKHCVLGTITFFDEPNEIIHLIPVGSQREIEIPIPLIQKIELLHSASQHDLLPQHERLLKDVDFDNAILLQLPVSVWHGAYRIRRPSPIKQHDAQSVLFADQVYDKHTFHFVVERTN